MTTPQHLRTVAARTGLDGIAEALTDAAATIERRNAVIKLLEGDVAAAHEARRSAQDENAQLKERLARAGIEQRRAVAAEREACAKVCETTPWSSDIEWWKHATKREISERSAHECAAAIRARKDHA